MKRNSPFAMLRSPRKDRSSYDNIFDDEDDVEHLPLSTKRADFLEKEVQPDDTLQSIALEFNVSVADLKRINNIHKENEIFARKLIKIPHKPYSLLLESKFFKDKNESIEPVAGPSTSRQDEADVLVEIVKNSTATPLVSPESTPVDDRDGEETDVLLGSSGAATPDLTPLRCNGADGDMSWKFLLVVVVFLTIGGPIAYAWYFWFHLEKES